MTDPRDRRIDLVAELLATSAARRRERIERLAPGLLAELASAALEGWSRERAGRESDRARASGADGT